MRALERVHNISQALKNRIAHLDWMSPEAKKTALEKWTSFTPRIGCPDQWRHWSGLTLTCGRWWA